MKPRVRRTVGDIKARVKGRVKGSRRKRRGRR